MSHCGDNLVCTFAPDAAAAMRYGEGRAWKMVLTNHPHRVWTGAIIDVREWCSEHLVEGEWRSSHHDPELGLATLVFLTDRAFILFKMRWM